MNKNIAILLAWVVLAMLPVGAAQAASTGGNVPTAAQAKKILGRTKPLAKQGNANAQYNMGVLYANGYGVQQNYKAAMQWYKKAAAQHYAKAEHNLGIMYQSGQGVAKDPKQAAQWFKRAAQDGEPAAQNNLAVMYMRGQGVPQNIDKAAMWAARAAHAGNQPAISNLPHITTKLPRSHITGDHVNIRAQPNQQARVVRQVDRDTRVVRLARQGQWTRVLLPTNYTLGWVADSLLAKAPTRVSTAAPSASNAGSGDVNKANKPQAAQRTAGQQSRVKSVATSKSATGSAQPGSGAISQTHGAKNNAPNTGRSVANAAKSNSAGRTQSNTASNAAASAQPQNTAAATNRHITGSGVNIRRKPNAHADILFQAQKDDKVSVLRKSHDWRYVRFASGRTGWVASFLIGK